MLDYRSTLERLERRVAMPEPAMERLLGRREHKARAQRVATVVGALAIAVVGIGAALLALREARPTPPAGGASASPSSGGDGIGGFVLPTIAVWIGIAVLGLTALAIARLGAHPAGPTEHQPRVHARTEPGHGPATAERGTEGKGGTTMDSKARLGASGDVRLAGIRMDDGKVRRTNRWLTIAVIVLAAGVVALGVALIAQSGNEAAPAPAKPTVGLADAATVQMFDALNEAASTDGERYASFFAENGVLDESVGVTKGREAIARHIQRYIDGGFWVERDGPVIQNGLFAAHAISAATGSGMAMYQLTPDGKIQHLWAFVH